MHLVSSEIGSPSIRVICIMEITAHDEMNEKSRGTRRNGSSRSVGDSCFESDMESDEIEMIYIL